MDIRSIHRTRGCNILIKLGKGKKDTQAFESAAKTSLGDIGAVRSVVPRITLQCMDLNCITTKENVKEALRRDPEGNVGDFKVSVSKASKWDQVMTIADINEEGARKLL